MIKYVLRLTLTLLLITAVVAGLLGFVNWLTVDRIAELTQEKANAAMQEVLPADSYAPIDTDGTVKEAFRADDKGYVVRVEADGFGGKVDMMVGVDNDCAVTGVSIISHTETSGLGANCTREDFRAQFTGMSGTLAVTKDGGEVEALTGATVTSRGVTAGINAALSFIKEVQK